MFTTQRPRACGDWKSRQPSSHYVGAAMRQPKLCYQPILPKFLPPFKEMAHQGSPGQEVGLRCVRQGGGYASLKKCSVGGNRRAE